MDCGGFYLIMAYCGNSHIVFYACVHTRPVVYDNPVQGCVIFVYGVGFFKYLIAEIGLSRSRRRQLTIIEYSACYDKSTTILSYSVL